ncbi:hypothetical protein [Aquiflexum sp.]|uniref:hypothetical protein n=1 Tax=Aquiflexum sp. TaxID=1872584 RepID=UPI003594752D
MRSMKPMNRLFIASFLLGFLFFDANEAQAQKLMFISDELHENADRFEVGMKGGTGRIRYHYNSFKVTKVKVGWTKSKYRSKLFSPLETASSERKLSYEFISHKGDTAWVNLNRNMNYEGINREGLTFFGRNTSINIGGYQEVLENSDNLFGVIETNSDDVVWSFIVSEKYGTIVGDRPIFVGWLTNGDRKIDILPVFDYQNPGKKNLVDMMFGTEIWLKGFEFVENAKSLGAVQIGPMRKMFIVWFSKKNDPMTDFVMGSTFAALMWEYQIDMDSNF